ncbi:MAG: ribosome maturation factor RimP [Candidatus Syntrophonatronum acetioxidans]|uniref:Ribosome maturation factor RimP n=1 Tax=Candidatus Syntrophonatronum acetioxidans TaxID=1795816 RepID=A0A424YE03_9FIRM|nr:MAG: ribosome maturation factor RimP [Candidatus Syntrophonatronum acetioxidans]
MNKKKITESVEELVEPILEDNGMELVEVEFVKEGGNWYLRLFIDKPEGVTLDDCKLVNDELSEILDMEDPIPQSYILEVSSPGVERPLKKEKDFVRFSGEKIKVKTYMPINNQKNFKGLLQGCREGIVQMELENGKQVSIPLDKIAKANLLFEL